MTVSTSFALIIIDHVKCKEVCPFYLYFEDISLMYIFELCVCVSLSVLEEVTQGVGFPSLDLEVQVAVSCNTGTGSQTWVLSKRSPCS